MSEDRIRIRPILEDDVEVLYSLICALAENQNERAFLTVTPDRLRETGFCNDPMWRGYIAEIKQEAVGYATYTEDFHIWSGAPRITLDDIFVRPDYRSYGLGERLMRQVFDIAQRHGASVNWTVQTSNSRAIEFYERLGAKYRVIGKCNWRADE